MIFLRFNADDGSVYVFAGERGAILEDTKDGTEFGFVRFTGHRLATDQEVREIGFKYYDDAVKVARAYGGSYLVGILNPDGKPSEWRGA